MKLHLQLPGLLLLLFALSGYSGESRENLARLARTLGSSFQGSATRTVATDCYHTNVNDGKPETVWRPMAFDREPFLEFEWRWPLNFAAVAIHGSGSSAVKILSWNGLAYQPLATVPGDGKPQALPPVHTSRLRLEFQRGGADLSVAEVEFFGPAQPLTPLQLPVLESAVPPTLQPAQLKITPETVRPGDKVRVDCEVELPGPGVVMLDWKTPAGLGSWLGDYEIAGALAAGKSGRNTLNFELTTPFFAPEGKSPLYLYFLPDGGKTLLHGGAVGTLTVERPATAAIGPDHPAAGVGNCNGQLGFQIGERFEFPFFLRYTRTTGYEKFDLSRATGLDIQYFILYNRVLGLPSQWQEYFERCEQNIRAALAVRPESYFIIGIDLRPNPAWLRAHPEALMLDGFGRHPQEVQGEPGIVSMAAQTYRQDCLKFLDAFFSFLKNKEYAGRIVGYHPWACSQLDSHMGGIAANNMIDDRSKLAFGDFHPDAIALYRQWLRQKYHDDETLLRRTWNKPDATFATAAPTLAELWAPDASGGVFRDPRQHQSAIDYIEFFPTLLGGWQAELAGCIKRKTDRNALVLIHYGAVFATLRNGQPSGSRLHVQNYDLADLLNNPDIDGYIYAPKYEMRHAGDPYVLYLPLDSIALHGRLGLADNDERTFSASGLYHGKHRGVAESQAVMRRDIGFHLIKNGGAWLADMGQRNNREWHDGDAPWYARKEVAEAIHATCEVFRRELDRPRQSGAEIAVFTSLSSPRFEDPLLAVPVYYNLIERMYQNDLHRLGAPFDTYLMSDLANPGLKQDYKLYIFLNAFYLTSAERRAVEALKSNGHTLLWFYAPGYVTDNGLNADASGTLTGIGLIADIQAKQIPTMKFVTAPPKNFAPLAQREYRAETYGDNSWSRLHPAAISPNFHAVEEPGVRVLARDPAGQPALVWKKFKDWNSVYCAVPYLDSMALRALAQEANCNIYSEDDVFMTGDSRILLFGNGCDAPREIRVTLPRPTRITDAETGEVLCDGQRRFILPLAAPQTRLLRIAP